MKMKSLLVLVLVLNVVKAILILVLLICVSMTARATESNLVDAFVSAGETLAAKGQPEQAKTMLFKALAYNEKSAPAIFELARIYEKEGRKEEAAQFYQQVLSSGVPKYQAEAAAKVATLNPFQAKLTVLLKGYSEDLERVGKKSGLVRTEALQRATRLGLHLPALEFSPIGKWLKPDKSVIVFKEQIVTVTWPSGKISGTWLNENNKINVTFPNEKTYMEMPDEDSLVQGKTVYVRQK